MFIRSDWSKEWPNPELATRKEFPGVTLEALKFLHLERKILFHGHEALDTDTTPTLEGEAWLQRNGYTQANDRNFLREPGFFVGLTGKLDEATCFRRNVELSPSFRTPRTLRAEGKCIFFRLSSVIPFRASTLKQRCRNIGRMALTKELGAVKEGIRVGSTSG